MENMIDKIIRDIDVIEKRLNEDDVFDRIDAVKLKLKDLKQLTFEQVKPLMEMAYGHGYVDGERLNGEDFSKCKQLYDSMMKGE